MLLNFSNHPSSTWSEFQMLTAIEEYGSVIDLHFPIVSPEATPNEIEQLAFTYFHKIKEFKPSAVHLMGEMTFCFALCNILHKNGIKAIASTTKRIVDYEKDGNKISRFLFVQFREYL